MMKATGILCACGLLAAGCATEPMGGSSDTSRASTRSSTGAMSSSSAAMSGAPGRAASSSTAGSLSSQEVQFMREAAQSGLAEVQIGQLAQQKGQSQHVKQIGQMLVRDHQKANQELMTIAAQNGVQLPTQIGAKEQALIQRLNSASGSQFDQLAAAENVRAHQEVVQKFQTAQQTVQDPELKAFIQKTLPVLQSHLDHAKQAQAEDSNSAQGGSESMEPAGSTQQGSSASQNTTPQPTPGSPPMGHDQADQQ